MSAAIAPAVQQQAALWLVELQSDELTAHTRRQLNQRLETWRQAHADHERAWQRIEAMGLQLQPLAGTPASAALAHAARSVGRGRRVALRNLALLLFSGAAAGTLAWQAQGETPGVWLAHWGADESTGTAERRAITLPDGTQLELNARSALDVQYDERWRLLRLRAGEILVTTAPGSTALAQPLVVETRHGRIRALGTRFAVRERGLGSTHVMLFEGQTEITPQRSPARRFILSKGEQVRFDAEHAETAERADASAIAWTRGMLVAQDMPLAEFLAELARHRPGYLGCDPVVARLPISGTYPLADTDRVLDMLLATQPLALRTATRYWVSVQPR
ncbi:MAG: FecR domain-containing protein [Comamonas sp.]